MTEITGNNYYHGNYYLPIKPLPDEYLRNGSDTAEMLEAGLTPEELAMNIVIENSRFEDYINFDEVEEFTHHWRLTDKQKALDGLVEKKFLVKSDSLDDYTMSNIEDIASHENGCIALSYENFYETFLEEKVRLFTCGDQLLSDVIDYMSQFAFGFYIACIDVEKDGIFDPEWLKRYYDWDKNRINRGIAILGKYGYLKGLYKKSKRIEIIPENYKKYLFRPGECQYYLFRKSIFKDFPKFIFD